MAKMTHEERIAKRERKLLEELMGRHPDMVAQYIIVHSALAGEGETDTYFHPYYVQRSIALTKQEETPTVIVRKKMKIVTSLMTKQGVKIPVDTPHSCDPSTETYWSM